jgi:hypothetical protein
MEQISFLPEPEPTPEPEPIHIGQRVWGCDYGSGYFHLHCDGNYRKVMPEQFAALSFASAGDVVVIENAHMQPKARSLAQVFTYDELVAIKTEAERRDITIRLWFHSQTPKWRAMLKMGDKSDEIDAKTIYSIIQHRGLDGLQHFNPRSSYPPRIEWAHDQIKDMNLWLNNARMDYGAKNCAAFHLYFDKARPAIQTMLLRDQANKKISIDLYKDCTKWWIAPGHWAPSEHKNGLSLWAAFVASDGTTRKCKGQIPGVKFVMQELLRQRPNHFMGGVARSNIMHHSFKNEAIAHVKTRKKKTKEDDKTILPLHEYDQQQMKMFLALRRRYRKAMTTTLHAMRQYLIERDVV